MQALLAAYPEAAKATDKVRRPGPCVPRACGLSPTRRPPRRSAAPLLAVCATYRTGTRQRRRRQRQRRTRRRRIRPASTVGFLALPEVIAYISTASLPTSKIGPRTRTRGRSSWWTQKKESRWERIISTSTTTSLITLPSTTPLRAAHRWRRCRRCSRHTRRPPRRLRCPAQHARRARLPASLLSRSSARRVCPVQLGYTPLHRAAVYSSSVAVVQALLAANPEAAKATDKVVRRPRPYVPRSCGLSPTRPSPRRSVAPLLAVCATYRTGRRHSTMPLESHRRRWCWRCSRRTRRPPRRRTRYAAPGPVCRAHATSPPPPLASSLSHPLLAVSAPYSWGTGRRPSTSPLRSAHRWRWFRRSSWRTRRPSWRRTRYAAPGPVCRDHGASPPPAARLVAQPPPCSPCVPRIGREHAPPPRRSVQLIGGGCSGAARGVP